MTLKRLRRGVPQSRLDTAMNNDTEFDAILDALKELATTSDGNIPRIRTVLRKLYGAFDELTLHIEANDDDDELA